MAMRAMIMLLALTACTSAPLTSSVAQNMCAIDPLTGQCYTAAELCASETEQYAWDNYAPDSVDNASCTASNGNAICQVSLYTAAGSLMLYCQLQYVMINGRWTVTSITCGAR